MNRGQRVTTLYNPSKMTDLKCIKCLVERTMLLSSYMSRFNIQSPCYELQRKTFQKMSDKHHRHYTTHSNPHIPSHLFTHRPAHTDTLHVSVFFFLFFFLSNVSIYMKKSSKVNIKFLF